MAIEERRVPVVRLFAVTPTIESAGGIAPARGRERCVEAAAWLVEHPNRPAAFMARSLGIAETTRRSTLSRLRWWLDVAPDGRMYLPLAYRGTVSLAPEVTSDWARIQRLVVGGVDMVPHDRLISVLDLVRGPFLGNQTSSRFMWGWADATARRAHNLIGRVAVRAATQARTEGNWAKVDWIRDRALNVLTEPELLDALEPASARTRDGRPTAPAPGPSRWEVTHPTPDVRAPAALLGRLDTAHRPGVSR